MATKLDVIMRHAMRYGAPHLIFCVCLLAAVGVNGQERSPALLKLVDESTEVFVGKVLKTDPSKAMEGARDTVLLEVSESLKGDLAEGQRIGIYYHLLWKDTTTWTLEDKKFKVEGKYAIFTRSHFFVDGDTRTRKYEFTDRWLSVQDPHPELLDEIRVHVAHPPELVIELLPGSKEKPDVPKIVSATRTCWRPPQHYWAQPFSLVETPDHWLVKFTRKGKLRPSVTAIAVDKATLSCKVVGEK